MAELSEMGGGDPGPLSAVTNPKPSRLRMAGMVNGLLVQVEVSRRSATLRCATGVETATLSDDTPTAPGVVLTRKDGVLTMRRAKDNTAPTLTPLPAINRADAAEIAGRYSSVELGAELKITVRTVPPMPALPAFLAAAGSNGWRLPGAMSGWWQRSGQWTRPPPGTGQSSPAAMPRARSQARPWDAGWRAA